MALQSCDRLLSFQSFPCYLRARSLTPYSRLCFSGMHLYHIFITAAVVLICFFDFHISERVTEISMAWVWIHTLKKTDRPVHQTFLMWRKKMSSCSLNDYSTLSDTKNSWLAAHQTPTFLWFYCCWLLMCVWVQGCGVPLMFFMCTC